MRSLHARANIADGHVTPIDFSTLYANELSYVYRSLQRLGVPTRELDDLTQEVFITAFQRFDTYDQKRPLRPWLFGIAFRVASAQRNRAQVRREVAGELPDTRDERPSPHDSAEHSQTLAKVLLALDTLRIERKAVFILHDIEGQSIPEVAAALAIPLNTAYTRLRAARAEFTEAFRRLAPESP